MIAAAISVAVFSWLVAQEIGPVRIETPSTFRSVSCDVIDAAPPDMTTPLPVVASPATVTTMAVPLMAVPVVTATTLTVCPFDVAV